MFTVELLIASDFIHKKGILSPKMSQPSELRTPLYKGQNGVWSYFNPMHAVKSFLDMTKYLFELKGV